MFSNFLFENRTVYELMWAGIAQMVQGLATCWTIRGSNPSGGEIYRTRPDRPFAPPPNLLYTGYRVFPEAKHPWCDVDYPPHPAPNYTSTLPLCLRGLLWGEICLFNEIMWKNLHIRRDHK
jgi:hypothetical protein